MSLDNIVSVSVSAATITPTRPGFGTPLVACYTTRFPERTRAYTSLSAMISDGFTVGEPAYRAVAAAFSQKTRPATVKVGRRALAPTQVVKFTVTGAADGKIYTVTACNGYSTGAETTYTYTVTTGQSNSDVATAIAALIDVHADIVSAAVGAVITCTTAATKLVYYKNWTPELQLEETTADPGIATDLAAIWVEDTDWYGLALDNNGSAECVAAAAWALSNGRLFCYNCSDEEATNAGQTDDSFSVIEATANDHAVGLFNGNHTGSFSALAWMANRFPFDPGSDTWNFKTLTGVTVDSLSTLSESHMANIKAKSANYYTTLAGVNITQDGRTASGEWVDVVRFIDWLKSEIKIRVFAVLVNNQKVPFTDKGVDLIKSVIMGALLDGVTAGGLVAGTVEVTAPKVADVSSANKAERTLPNVTFTGTLAGAIHKTTIVGTLSV